MSELNIRISYTLFPQKEWKEDTSPLFIFVTSLKNVSSVYLCDVTVICVYLWRHELVMVSSSVYLCDVNNCECFTKNSSFTEPSNELFALMYKRLADSISVRLYFISLSIYESHTSKGHEYLFILFMNIYEYPG